MSTVENILSQKFTRIYEDLDLVGLIEFMVQIIRDMPDESVKVISLIGGAAGGKSTLARNLVNTLAKQGIIADSISTDDYVIGNRSYRREHFEGKEPRAKYDFAMMNQVIANVRVNTDGGKTVAVPTYDPVTGIAIAEGVEKYKHHIGKVNVLIVEGDFDEVTQPNLVFYLHMDDEKRLQNRISRDTKERDEADTALIRKNFEERQVAQHARYTLPAIQRASYVINVEPVADGWRYDIHMRK